MTASKGTALKILSAASIETKDGDYLRAKLLWEGAQNSQPKKDEAMALFQKLAASGHQNSQYILGIHQIQNGDIDGGMQLLIMAAESGHGMACTQLGHIYRNGAGVPRDAQKAVLYLTKGANLDIAEASFLLATYYESGDGIEGGRDLEQALKHYLESAKKGLSVAQHNVGSIYFNGTDDRKVPRDVQSAIEFWKMAASQRFVLSQINLARLYLLGVKEADPPIKQDLSLARRYLEDAKKTISAAEPNSPLLTEIDSLFLSLEAAEPTTLMRILGLTGGIATGKSTVSRALSEHNIPVVDADVIAREVLIPGNPAYRRIVNALGASNVLGSNQEIDRAKVGALVFQNPEARKKVNAATHPYIRLEMLRRMLWAFLCGHRVVVLDTPLLFEAGMDKWVHSIIVVYCPESVQKFRLMKRDDLTAEAAQLRVDAQMSIERKRQLANIVIDNTGSIRETRKKVDALVPDLRPSWLSTTLAWTALAWPAAVLYSLLTIIKVLKL
ncbi:hypothetical protein HDU97_003423 [Phlyctochytrium planicorne]|nr:hypothetical protein HDU97_003423 [Phlyctochytrium planicorne]